MAHRAKTHRCMIGSCPAQISIKHLACREHWLKIPPRLQDNLIGAWKYGLQFRCHPTQAFIDARDQACRYIEMNEAKATA